jgi:hypothetical protein
MFTLRRYTGNGVQMNQEIGDGYSLIDREINYSEFCVNFERWFNRKHVADLDPTADNDTKGVYAFIGNGQIIQPLYKNQTAYIMSETGQTFANVSFK